MGKPRGLASVPPERRLEIAAYGRQKLSEKQQREFEPKFWGRIDRSGGSDSCWPWTGPQNGNGYGVVRRDSKNGYTHRLAWELRNGQEIPPGMHACHKCDNRICCNPNHIFIGTAGDNIRDCYAKGRQCPAEKRSAISKVVSPRGDRHWSRSSPEKVKRGEHSPGAKLTDEHVAGIFAAHRAGRTRKDIAAEFGVHPVQVGRILSGKSWKHFSTEAQC